MQGFGLQRFWVVVVVDTVVVVVVIVELADVVVKQAKLTHTHLYPFVKGTHKKLLVHGKFEQGFTKVTTDVAGVVVVVVNGVRHDKEMQTHEYELLLTDGTQRNELPHGEDAHGLPNDDCICVVVVVVAVLVINVKFGEIHP